MNTPIELNKTKGILPVKFFLSEDMMPANGTISQLERLANSNGVINHVAVLPDVHSKGRNICPTGVSIATKGTIIPRAIDTGINCGMRMIKTDIDASELTPENIDLLFARLKEKVPVYLHSRDTISNEDVFEILLNGGRWSQKKYGLSDEEMDCIEDRGTLPTDAETLEEILEAIPEKSIKKGRRSLGTLGDGNHFLELQEIEEVLHPEFADLLGLHKGKVMFMMHTGSRGVGSKMMKGFLKMHEADFAAQAEKEGRTNQIWHLDLNSAIGKSYMRALSAVSNFGFANRIAITEKLRETMQEIFAEKRVEMPLLYDCSHVSIKHEKVDGENVLVHRHGASRALPPSLMADHNIFSQTGQPLPIPGSMGARSYIGVADEGALASFCSVNHGAGRVMDKPEAAEKFSEGQVEKELQDKNIRLYRYNSDNLAEQAPNSFKDISKVIKAMKELSLAQPVVKVKPIAVLKG